MADATASADSVAVDSKWWVPLVMGIVSVVFGLLLFTNPAGTSIWVAWLVGIYWFIGGVMNLIMMFVDRTQWGWKLVLGILGILAGSVVISAMGETPLLATIGLASVYVWVLGLQGIIYGIIQIIMAFQGGGWGVGILGFLSVILGGLLMANPVSGAVVLPWVFGIFAVAGGIAAIVIAFKLKSA
jgi:uncharacterized membrane protein HdeD (DUF308 family)